MRRREREETGTQSLSPSHGTIGSHSKPNHEYLYMDSQSWSNKFAMYMSRTNLELTVVLLSVRKDNMQLTSHGQCLLWRVIEAISNKNF